MSAGDDYRTALAWLSGELKEGTAAELDARRTLARMLRSGPLVLGVRVGLANAIDPDMRDSVGSWLTFKRSRGNRSGKMDHRRIAAVVWHRRAAGDPFEAAIRAAMSKCKASRATVTAAWREWSPHFRKLGGKLKALTRP
jgi:hypothetical protein